MYNKNLENIILKEEKYNDNKIIIKGNDNTKGGKEKGKMQKRKQNMTTE